MTLPELWVMAQARWRWVASVLVVIALLIGFKCYGDAQYDRGQSVARADVADSISKVYETRYKVLADSVTHEMAAFKASVTAANERAATAEARAIAAETRANTILTPQVIARTPPEVLQLLADIRASNKELSESNADLRVHLDTALARETRFASALELADSTIAQQRRTIGLLQQTKLPPHGFWHTVGEVAKDVGLAAGGVALGRAIF